MSESHQAHLLLKALTKAHGIPIGCLMTLLLVFKKPGVSITDLANEIAVPQQSASRFVAILMAKYQDGSHTFAVKPLIRQTLSDTDNRSRSLFLTDEGEHLLKKILKN